ncbi:MAG: hypothetical protein J6B12_05505 [Clostridia bacterium]|nr:hypothetical protein [Clostridia bacterium]
MKQANVIILAGQSNAVGVGYTKYLSKYYDEKTEKKIREGYDKVKIHYISHDIASGGFVRTTVNCTERSKDTLGPEIGIAKVLEQAYPNQEFFIIKCAFGGTNLAHNWRSPSTDVIYPSHMNCDPSLIPTREDRREAGWCYDTLVKHLARCETLLRDEGYEPRVLAFCWMQGESDADATCDPSQYIPRYDALLHDLHAAFPELLKDCLHIDAGISTTWTYHRQINQDKKEYAEKHGHIFIDTIAEGLTTRTEPEEKPDIAHYDCGSTVRLGELFASHVTLG